jgi:hypothetical protein
MSRFSDDYLRRVDAGKEPNAFIVYKFGRATGIGTSYVPVSADQTYKTPQTPQSLEVVSTSSADTNGGLGAWTVQVQGIGPDWGLQSEDIEMNGTTPVVLTKQFLRVFKFRVLGSGSYATESVSSHQGVISVRDIGGGDNWASIRIEGGLGLGTSLVANYTIPIGYVGYVIKEHLYSASTKLSDIMLSGRAHADQQAPPYSYFHAESIKYEASGADNNSPRGIGEELQGPYDIGYVAKASSGSVDVAISFEILVIKNRI